MPALDQTQASNLLNGLTPTGTTGKPSAITALSAAGGMKLRLTSTDSTAAAAGTTLSGTGSGDITLTTSSTASSAGSNVTLPGVSGGVSWTNGSGSQWNIHSTELQDNANTRNLFGAVNGDPVAIANGNTFAFPQNSITASLT